jgi:hypothetical protein
LAEDKKSRYYNGTLLAERKGKVDVKKHLCLIVYAGFTVGFFDGFLLGH